ncbi:MAG: type II toxin-antitoxin system VapC family toxin [Terriglobales bacterium]
MNLLLDTHIWLWRELSPDRVPAWAAPSLTNPENELWLSPLSTWELVQLCQRGRIRLDSPWPEWVAACWHRNRFRDAPLGQEVVAAAEGVELSHRDPMDWLLAATARYYGLMLVTADERLLAGRGFARLRTG